MRKLIAALAAALLMALTASSAGAAPIVDHGHSSGSDTFADNICGIDGTSVQRFVDDFQVFANNTFKDQFRGDTVFTSTASGTSLRDADEPLSSNAPTASWRWWSMAAR